MAKHARVTISKDGPYMVAGAPPLSRQTIVADREGGSERWQEGDTFALRETYALCRCGHSNNKPFCDGTHAKIDFDGAETASREPYLKQAKVLKGSSLHLPVASFSNRSSAVPMARSSRQRSSTGSAAFPTRSAFAAS